MSHLCMVAFHFVLKYRFFIEDSFLDPLKYLQVLVFFSWGFSGTQISHAVVLFSYWIYSKITSGKVWIVKCRMFALLAAWEYRPCLNTGEYSLDSDLTVCSEHPQRLHRVTLVLFDASKVWIKLYYIAIYIIISCIYLLLLFYCLTMLLANMEKKQ